MPASAAASRRLRDSIDARRSVMASRIADTVAIERAIGRRNVGALAARRFGSGDRGGLDGAADRSSHSPTACMTARALAAAAAGELSCRAGSAKNRSGRPITGAPGPRERDSGLIFPVSRRSVPQCDGTGLWQGLCLSCGTSLERIAPESLTRALSEFVHGHISCHHHIVPPDRVAGSSLSQSNELPSVKIEPIALQCGG
jgi:hypothetical protein